MKILTTTYFYDFARYFNYLESAIESKIKDVEFFNISIYPSAHFQWKSYQRHSILLPQQLHNIKNSLDIKKKSRSIEYKGINLENIISFNYISQKMFGLDENENLKIQAVKYIDYFDQLFSENSFDLYISSGDTRMLIEIANIFALRNGVKTFYFEQGPFGTTIMDEKGVNCNISFMDRYELKKDLNLNKLTNFIKEYKNTKTQKFRDIYNFSFAEKIINQITLVYAYPLPFTRIFFPIDTQLGVNFFKNIFPTLKKTLSIKNSVVIDETLPDKTISFILQVPVDAQLITNSPLYSDFFTMLTDIHQAIPCDYNLVVREHPGNLGKYDKIIYDYIDKHSNIYLINNYPLHELIKNSELIILNNSTVGIEALTHYKTVITLGNAYYNREGVVYNLKQKSELPSLIRTALTNPIAQTDINIFLYNFIFDYLYEGHYQDYSLKSADKIVSKLLERYLEDLGELEK